MLAKIIGNELGREGWSISLKMTTLLYYLIHSLLSFLAGVSKDNREWSFLSKMTTLLYYLIHSLRPCLADASKVIEKACQRRQK